MISIFQIKVCSKGFASISELNRYEKYKHTFTEFALTKIPKLKILKAQIKFICSQLKKRSNLGLHIKMDKLFLQVESLEIS